MGTTVVVPTKAALDERASLGWQLAWLERMSAWNLLRYDASDDAQAIQRELQPQLAQACDEWPELMHRCLALAELFIWTFYRGGLGVAMRFSSDRSSCLRDERPNAEFATETRKAPLAGYGVTLPAPKIVTGATGVIIDYDVDRGHIVVKHPSSPSLAATVKAYNERNSDSYSWIVPFSWNAISKADQTKLRGMYKRGLLQIGTRKTLQDIMRGMAVHCELRKGRFWEVSSMSIAFNEQRFNIAARNRL